MRNKTGQGLESSTWIQSKELGFNVTGNIPSSHEGAVWERVRGQWEKREGTLVRILVWRQTAGLPCPSAIHYRDVLHAAVSSLQNGAEWGGGGAKPGMVISSLCCGFRACGVAWARGPCDWAAVTSKSCLKGGNIKPERRKKKREVEIPF